jgi:hypothetical protein
MKARKTEKHGKRKEGRMRRRTTIGETGMAKRANNKKENVRKDPTKNKVGKTMRMRKIVVNGMMKRKKNGEAVCA